MILVLRALGVGDLATGVPALRALRAAYPGRELILAAPRWLAPLVGLVGGVDRLLPLDGLDPIDPPGPAPEVAVNLHGRGPRSHRLLAATGPRRLLAFANPAAGHLDGPRWCDDEHEVQRWCRLLAWYGIPADRADLALSRPPPDRVPTGVTVVHPGSKVPAKRWPARRFAALARELTDRGHRVLVTGSADERELAGWVAYHAGLPPQAVLAGRTDLGDLAALVAYARLVVSGDTGVAHLATAYGTASVVLFGPVPPARWGPPPDRPWHRVLWAGDSAAGGAAGGRAGGAAGGGAAGGRAGGAAGGGAGGATGGAVGGVRSGDRLPPGGVRDAAVLAAVGVDDVLAAVDEAERAVRISGAVTA